MRHVQTHSHVVSRMFAAKVAWVLLCCCCCVSVCCAYCFATTAAPCVTGTAQIAVSSCSRTAMYPSSVERKITTNARRRQILGNGSSSSTLLNLALIEWNGEISDEDAEMLNLIRGPAGVGSNPAGRKPKSIFILSDATGITAKSAVERALAQFNGCDERYTRFIKVKTEVEYYAGDETSEDNSDEQDCENITTRSFPFLKNEDQIASILKRATSSDLDVVVVFTLADPALRESTRRMCELSGLLHVDLLGPMLDRLATFFDRPPLGSPVMMTKDSTRRKALSDDYFRRIEAVEYTLQCDDGRNTHRLGEADVILLGVSRTGKTPLSVVLAQTMGLKVANVPLVVDLPPPKQLLDRRNIDRRRVFCLTLDPDDLQRIRKTRIQRELAASSGRTSSTTNSSGRNKSTYADRRYLIRDIQNAQSLTLEHGFTEIDVTGRAVEETASWISSLLNERFGDQDVRKTTENR